MALKTQASTITLKGNGILKERAATAAINPGYLVELDGEGVKPQATAGAVCAKAFALENDLFGNGTEVAYKSKENVLYAVFSSGKEVLAKLPAQAAAIAIGDALQANGDGTLVKQTATNFVVGFSLVAINNSGGDNEVFIEIEVL